MRRLKPFLWIAVLCPLLSLPITVEASAPPDFLKVEIGVQLKEDGRLTDELHHLRLSCFEGECEISTLVLNRCSELPDWNVQTPFFFVEKSSDRNASFNVKGNVIDISVVSTGFGGKTITTYRFELSHMPNGSKVTKFSGGYLKDSNILNRLIKVEFMPLRGPYSKVEPACPFELPGVPGHVPFEFPGIPGKGN